MGVEGMMLKRATPQYGVGPHQGRRHLVEVEDRPAQRSMRCWSTRSAATAGAPASTATTPSPSGTARRAADRKLVPFAKAYSGLTDAEMAQVDAIIRKTTVESFGPVRSVQPTLVFELGFEGIARSPRHKSGIAVRFPRMLRWREDKPVEDADTLQTLAALLPS